MRRSIWCTGVVLIGGAAWLYMAATYVCNYPNSYLGRCADVAYRMGGEFNPAYRLSHAFAERIRQNVDVVLQDHGYTRVERASDCHPCDPCVPSLEAIAASAPYSLIEMVPPATEECKGGVSEECTSGVITVGAFAPPAGDDADPAPKTMPPLPPDQGDEAPATMPYEEDENDPEGTALFDFWKSYQKKSEQKEEPKEAPKTMKPEEESETTPDGSASETPETGTMQMPASHYSSHPSCTGCPGTVTCPYTGRTYPSNPDDDPKEPVVPTPTHKKKKKKKDDAGNMPSKMSRLIEMEKGTEDVPVHPEVDTMEFRLSDGKKAEFKPQPE